MMLPDKICKTIHQYNKEPISPEDMKKLKEIAEDYCKVKNYVYQRYGGIKSLSKLYPGYTIQNEMTQSGLRAQLGLPSVYFYLAVFDALGDIKKQWARIKNSLLTDLNRNERFTPEDKHYLRFVIKMGGCFENILLERKITIPEDTRERYEETASKVNVGNLNRYLCRKVRKKIKRISTSKADGFAITERAYRYGRNGEFHGIFISTKENRKRVFVPLTDTNQYKKQLRIRLDIEYNTIKILIPIEKEIIIHNDYTNKVGISMGMWQMFTTHEGHVYGEKLGEIQGELTEFISSSTKTYQREMQNNPGRKKYYNRKAKLEAKLHDYINHEINRMLETEMPEIIYIQRLPKPSVSGKNKKINYSTSMWQRGYIRKHLEYKCRENNIEIVEVLGNGISTQCSNCGAEGICIKDVFKCNECGYEADKKINAARNAFERGRTNRVLHNTYSNKEGI